MSYFFAQRRRPTDSAPTPFRVTRRGGILAPLTVLNEINHLGLISAPSPLTALPGLADRLGLRSLTLKRDDLLPALGGGTKARKLDVVLANGPIAEAPFWLSSGAIGSGHLVALVAAGRVLRRPVHAHVFWEPVSVGVRPALAFIASYAASVIAHRGRMGLGLMHPKLVLGYGRGVLPPGGSTPAGIVGVARGALEVAAQIRAGSLPVPDHVIVPVGSGGTVAGLRLGFALAGLRPMMHAVTVVEPLFAGRRRIDALGRGALRWLRRRMPIDALDLPPLNLRTEQLGAGYAIPTAAGARAQALLADLSDVALESVYSAKAMAALLEGERLRGDVLFWVTPRGSRALTHRPDWPDRLPGWLVDRLARRPDWQGLTRRRAIRLGVGGLVAGLVAARTLGYPDLPGWTGAHLAPWEAHVLRAAAEALAPEIDGATLDAVPTAVDRYLTSLPLAMINEVHLMLRAVEHGTILQASRRFTRMARADRQAWLARLGRFTPGRLAWRGLRDLCFMGIYQQPSTWAAIGYGGPTLPSGLRIDRYASLRATTRPPGWSA